MVWYDSIIGGTMGTTNLFAQRMERLTPSIIGELVKSSKDTLSLAEGVPAPELFPVEEIAASTQHVLAAHGASLLQYGNYMGYESLRQEICGIVKKRYNMDCHIDQVIMTNGSTQGMDLCGRAFINEGDVVLTESPTYIDAMGIFSGYGASIEGIPCDNEGMDLTALQEALLTKRVKAIYVIPDFQNPTGRYWSVERRKAFMDLVSQYDVMVWEDAPYGEIIFTDDYRPSLASLDTKEQVIFLGSFSKTFSPGLRVGYMIASPAVVDTLSLVKEGIDLHSAALNQAIISDYMAHYSYEEHVQTMCKVYKNRLDALAQALVSLLPEFTFVKPEGGFFLWATVPSESNGNSMDFMPYAKEAGVVFVPGAPFYPTGEGPFAVRLNFTGLTEEKLAEAVQRLQKAYHLYVAR